MVLSSREATSLRSLIVGSGILNCHALNRLTLVSSRGVDFLKDRRIESEPSEREFYFLKGGRESASSNEEGFYGK